MPVSRMVVPDQVKHKPVWLDLADVFDAFEGDSHRAASLCEEAGADPENWADAASILAAEGHFRFG